MHNWEIVNAYSRYHPRWFESSVGYAPTSEHVEAYEALAPPDWSFRRSGLWYVAEPPGVSTPEQGWKIHVAIRSEDSVPCLQRAARCALDASVSFKFLLDRQTLAEVNGKLWSRGSSGKFMTFYPPDERSFLRLGGRLASELKGFTGPYILSDRRWPDSSCVYYRYGGFSPRTLLQEDGSRQFVIADSNGSYVPDMRRPYWHLPEWLTDPLAVEQASQAGSALELCDGRFLVTSALNFSNRGGVYLADDKATGQTVVIKEARPHIEVGVNRIDAVDLLKKEHRILRDLSDCGSYVRPIEMFEERGHAFLVEEYLPGDHLGRYSIKRNPLYRANITEAALNAYYADLRHLWLQLAQAVKAAHHHGVALGDLSFGNVIVTGPSTIRVIDLECAVEEGVDPHVGLHTPGMATPEAVRSGITDRGNDVYALGAVVFGSVMLATGISELHPPSRRRFLADLADDLKLSDRFVGLLDELMDQPASGHAPDIDQVIAAIADVPITKQTPHGHKVPDGPARNRGFRRPPRRDMRELASRTRVSALSYLERTATPERSDRLFPADPAVFETNPLSVAYGAAGVLHAFHHVGGRVPPHLAAWMADRNVTNESYPPGLYLGEAGIAWVLHEIGQGDAAAHLTRKAGRHPLLGTSPNVLYGAAGYGIACLKFWLEGYGDEFLDAAVQVGEQLIATCVQSPQGACWPDAEGDVPLGYAFGGSGVALFMLYLFQATQDERAFVVGRSALAYDLANAVLHGEELEGFPAMTPRQTETGRIVPRCYWDSGSAGVLTALIRYLAVRPDDTLRQWLSPLVENVHHKYAVFPQIFHGLSGMGNSLLDVWRFTKDPQYRQAAWTVAEGVLLFRIDCAEGVGFPGEQAVRESADFATGTAGVALFLDRLIKSDSSPAENFNFVVDELIPNGT